MISNIIQYGSALKFENVTCIKKIPTASKQIFFHLFVLMCMVLQYMPSQGTLKILVFMDMPRLVCTCQLRAQT